MIKTPKLEDAQAWRVLHPDTFEAPSNSQIRRLWYEDFVQLSASGERFWVKLLWQHTGTFVGIVDNELRVEEHGLKLGDLVQFQAHNVYKIMPSESRPNLPRWSVMADKHTGSVFLFHSQKPRFVAQIIFPENSNEKHVKIRDVMIIDEPDDYEGEMPRLLEKGKNWFIANVLSK